LRFTYPSHKRSRCVAAFKKKIAWPGSCKLATQAWNIPWRRIRFLTP
jgi:hypothetical protein